MRSGILQLKIVARALGLSPWVALVLYCMVAALEEPTFFRLQGLDLAWPGSAIVADIVTLAAYLVWSDSVARGGCLPSVVSSFLALTLVALLASLAAVLGCTLLDLARGLSVNLHPGGVLLLRTTLTWAPVALLTVALTRRFQPPARPALLVAAFVIQAAIHSVSMAGPGPTLGNFFFACLALCGSAALASATHQRPAHAN